jgi:hypothetical protein
MPSEALEGSKAPRRQWQRAPVGRSRRDIHLAAGQAREATRCLDRPGQLVVTLTEEVRLDGSTFRGYRTCRLGSGASRLTNDNVRYRS